LQLAAVVRRRSEFVSRRECSVIPRKWPVSIERTQVGWGLWLWWVLASTVGLLIGGAVGTAVGGALFPAEGGAVALAVAFAVTGAVIGTAQWLALRQHLSRAGWWVLASILGFAMFGAVYEADAVVFAVVFVVVGAAVGIAQWLVLRQHLPRAGWWVLASTIGFAIFGAVPSLFEALFEAVGFAVGAAVALVFVATYGGITGAALVWLLRQPAAE
jgi:hypothetical protein